jgi:hypothetical protein
MHGCFYARNCSTIFVVFEYMQSFFVCFIAYIVYGNVTSYLEIPASDEFHSLSLRDIFYLNFQL